MSLLGDLLGGPLERKVTDASALTWSILAGGPSSKAGVAVNVDTALKVSTVLACCRVLAEGVAQIPLKLLREGVDGTKAPAREHALFGVLAMSPNSWQTSFQWRETAMYHALLSEKHVSWISRSATGEVLELLPLVPTSVAIHQWPDWSLTFQVTAQNSGRSVVLPQSEVFYLPGPSWNGYGGLDVVRLAGEAIGLAIATEESQSRLHSNGGKPGGLLTTDQVLKKETKNDLRADWAATVGGQNKFGTAVLDAGMKFQALSMTGVDSQHLETRKHQIEEICRVFRVFPQMIGYSDKTSTYASAEQFFTAHVVHSLGPWIERWEQALARALLTPQEIRRGYFPKFNVNGLLRGDVKSRAEFYKASLGTASSPGWNSPNDIRRLEDQDPSDAPGADKIVTVDDLSGKQPPGKAVPPVADPAIAGA